MTTNRGPGGGAISIFDQLDSRDKEIAQLKARIRELETAKPKDDSEYEFEIDGILNHTVIKGNWYNIFGKNCYEINIRFLEGPDNKIYSAFVDKEQLQTIVTTLQKVLDDGVLK